MVVRVVMLMISFLAHSQHCIGERFKRAIQPRGAVMVVRVVMLIIRLLDRSRVKAQHTSRFKRAIQPAYHDVVCAQ